MRTGSSEFPLNIIFSDVHLMHKPKAWRSPEPDWYLAMQRVFDEIKFIQDTWGDSSRILIAGDIFDHWNSPAELINFAIQEFKRLGCVYAVPGQHDLPNHSYAEMHRSAFQTLKMSRVLSTEDTHDGHGTGVNFTMLGWEREPFKINKSHRTSVAIIHKYVWMKGCSYANAPKTGKCRHLSKALGVPDYIFAGDNHQGFYHAKSGVFNCGGLMRTTKDQIDYKPRIALLFSDGTLVPYYLDTSRDVYLTTENLPEVVDPMEESELYEFMDELRQMGRGGLDYLTAVRKVTSRSDIRKDVARIINSILEEVNG